MGLLIWQGIWLIPPIADSFRSPACLRKGTEEGGGIKTPTHPCHPLVGPPGKDQWSSSTSCRHRRKADLSLIYPRETGTSTKKAEKRGSPKWRGVIQWKCQLRNDWETSCIFHRGMSLGLKSFSSRKVKKRDQKFWKALPCFLKDVHSFYLFKVKTKNNG